jgi:hypothetical protein
VAVISARRQIHGESYGYAPRFRYRLSSTDGLALPPRDKHARTLSRTSNSVSGARTSTLGSTLNAQSHEFGAAQDIVYGFAAYAAFKDGCYAAG